MSLSSRAHTMQDTNQADEQGAIMVLFAALLLSVLTLIGLAIDTGNLYSAKIGVQAAADAGALAAASMSALGRPIGEVRQGAIDVAAMNLQIKGIENPTINVPMPDTSDGISIQVQVSADVGMYILSKLPSVGVPFQTVSAEAVSNVNPAAISLMLDVSESMACPADTGVDEPACSCSPNCDQNDLSSRMSALKLAILGDSTDPRNPGFLSYFDEARDAIGLVLFGTGAKTAVKMKKNGGFVYSEIATAIRNAKAQGATNHSDALYQAYFDTEEAQFLDEASFVLFSDGAPTAARFIFREAAVANYSVMEGSTHVTPPALLNKKPWAIYDYLSWGVTKGGTSLPLQAHFYPPYNNTGNNGFWEPMKLASIQPARPPAWTVDQSIPRNAQLTDLLDTSRPWADLQKMVGANGMRVVMPDQSTHQLGFDSRWAGGTYAWGDWSAGEHLQLYADNALAIADIIRSRGNVFYGVGYGQAAAGGFDPYQNAQEPATRKDYFMNRMTIDPCALADFNPPFPGIKSLPELAAGGISTGSYYPAASPEQMQDVFGRIARKIKMKLVK